MQKYQERVIKELYKLEKKSCKLQEFINSDDCPLVEGSEELDLLVSQLHAMWVYASILKRRIQNFSVSTGMKDPEDKDLFENIGMVEVEDGDVEAALGKIFDIVKNKMKETDGREK